MFPPNTDLALLLLRLWFGLEMAFGHGLGKFKKILNGDLGFLDPIGLGPTLSLYLTTFAEFICAILIVIGYKTRWAAIPFAFAMLIAAYFHFNLDPEYRWSKVANPINYMVPALALLLAGPGRYSLDHQLAQRNMV